MSQHLYTSSSAKTARTCLRLYRLTYVEGWKPRDESENLRFGTLIHKALEAWWLATKAGLRADERLAAALDALAYEADPFDRARADVLTRGYDARWGADEYEVLAVEHEFRVPLVNPETGAPSRTFDLAGKLDVLVKDADGRVLIVEHKTTSEDPSPGGEYLRRLRIDGQISTYYAAVKALGYDVAGCLYDVLKKPTLRPAKATPEESRKYKKDGTPYANQRLTDETPEEYHARLVEAVAADPAGYFQRAMIVRLEDELAEAQADAWQTAQVIREARRTNQWPRNPDACSRYGRTCGFFDVCTGAGTLDADRFVRVGAHPELTQGTTAAESPAA